ncbi:SURF1 family protein [Virgisporangium ochraceum]|uniref:SURF1-like protein n=2 Tax=Virgisporangium ochraceum TaxID=65505 RepID=A0A8J3ZRH4_9ACTN|nr:SURF1 family protein [Virgisporangium ochraceum]GIJ67702.1 SURF1-like protein [Virgisporangium ochraceum]
MYRFLLTRRWLGLAALMFGLAVVMVGLGNWQLSRYQQKSAINERIDAAAVAAPVAVENVLVTGRAPAREQRYTRVTATGRYDPTNEILARGRTIDDRVGYEILTPLVLPDGTALLVDRGWVPAGANALAIPEYPAAPTGDVTVTGAVRLPERQLGKVERTGGRLQVRRINPAQLGRELPYPVLGGYVSIEQDGLRPVSVEYEGTLQNGGYALQWWAFAALTLVGYVHLVRKQVRENRPQSPEPADGEPDRESAPAG